MTLPHSKLLANSADSVWAGLVILLSIAGVGFIKWVPTLAEFQLSTPIQTSDLAFRCTSANQTSAAFTTIFKCDNTCVFGVEMVPINAVRFSLVCSGRTVSDRAIECLCNNTQVLGIYTQWISANVVDNQAFGDTRLVEQLPRESMGKFLTINYVESTVTKLFNEASPKPAAVTCVFDMPQKLIQHLQVCMFKCHNTTKHRLVGKRGQV